MFFSETQESSQKVKDVDELVITTIVVSLRVKERLIYHSCTTLALCFLIRKFIVCI